MDGQGNKVSTAVVAAAVVGVSGLALAAYIWTCSEDKDKHESVTTTSRSLKVDEINQDSDDFVVITKEDAVGADNDRGVLADKERHRSLTEDPAQPEDEPEVTNRQVRNERVTLLTPAGPLEQNVTVFGDESDSDDDDDDGIRDGAVADVSSLLRSLVNNQLHKISGDPSTIHPSCVGYELLGRHDATTVSLDSRNVHPAMIDGIWIGRDDHVPLGDHGGRITPAANVPLPDDSFCEDEQVPIKKVTASVHPAAMGCPFLPMSYLDRGFNPTTIHPACIGIQSEAAIIHPACIGYERFGQPSNIPRDPAKHTPVLSGFSWRVKYPNPKNTFGVVTKSLNAEDKACLNAFVQTKNYRQIVVAIELHLNGSIKRKDGDHPSHANRAKNLVSVLSASISKIPKRDQFVIDLIKKTGKIVYSNKIAKEDPTRRWRKLDFVYLVLLEIYEVVSTDMQNNADTLATILSPSFPPSRVRDALHFLKIPKECDITEVLTEYGRSIIRRFPHKVETFKGVAKFVRDFHLESKFTPDEILLPLVIGNSMNVCEAFVAEKPELQSALLALIDDRLAPENDPDSIRAAEADAQYALLREDSRGVSPKELAKRRKKFLTAAAFRIAKKFDMWHEIKWAIHTRNGGTIRFLLEKRREQVNYRKLNDRGHPSTQTANIDELVWMLAKGDVELEEYIASNGVKEPNLEPEYEKGDVSTALHQWLAQWDNGKPNSYYKLPNLNIFLVDTIASLIECQKFIIEDEEKIIGIDSEWRSCCTPQEEQRCALLQLAIGDNVFLLDLLQLGPTQTFADFLLEIITKHEYTKIGLGLKTDFKMIAGKNSNLIGLSARSSNCVDLEAVFRKIRTDRDLPPPASTSLDTLCKLFLDAQLDKTEQLSDWERRPLRLSQIHYASADAYVLLCLHKKLEEVSNSTEPMDLGTDLAVQHRPNPNGKKRNKKKPKRKEVAAGTPIKAPVGTPIKPSKARATGANSQGPVAATKGAVQTTPRKAKKKPQQQQQPRPEEQRQATPRRPRNRSRTKKSSKAASKQPPSTAVE